MPKIRIALLATSLATLGACSQEAPAPAVDDALRNDLALAATVRAPAPQQHVGPAELGHYPPGYAAGYAPQPYAQPYAPQYAPQPYYVAAAPAPAPRPRATVRRTASASRSTGSSAGTVYRAPAEQPTRVVKHTKRDAAIGAVAGAAIGVAASSKKDRVKGGLIGAVAGAAIGVAASSKKDRLKGGIIGAVAGGVLGGVIGNNVDVKRIPY